MVSIEDALDRSEMAGLDLVEVSFNKEAPVCKIMDYGKHKFQQQKKASEARKKQQIVTVKEITLRPRTEEHDYQVKLRNAIRFINRGDKVKFTLRFRGREMAHQEIAMNMMLRLKEDLAEIAKVENHPKMDGRTMVMIVAPAN